MQMHLTTKQATLEQDIHPCEDVPHQIIDVNTGEVKIASGPIMLRSVAIGSCIVVATLDSEKKSVRWHILCYPVLLRRIPLIKQNMPQMPLTS